MWDIITAAAAPHCLILQSVFSPAVDFPGVVQLYITETFLTEHKVPSRKIQISLGRAGEGVVIKMPKGSCKRLPHQIITFLYK